MKRHRIDSGEARRIADKLGHLAEAVLATVDGVTATEMVRIVEAFFQLGRAFVAALRHDPETPDA